MNVIIDKSKPQRELERGNQYAVEPYKSKRNVFHLRIRHWFVYHLPCCEISDTAREKVRINTRRRLCVDAAAAWVPFPTVLLAALFAG